MGEILLLVVGAVVGFLVNEFLGRGLRAVERRRARGTPLIMHVETDPSVIWANMPPWIGAGFLVPPDADISSPPKHCPDWRRWVRALGGVDQGVTNIRVTLTARRDLLVVVDAIRVKVHERRPVPPWRAITCAVGGADITPRRGEINLSMFDPPLVDWIDDGGDPTGMPTFSLSAGAAEILHLWATVDEEWVEWTAQLMVIVDGHRQVVEIADDGKPFVTTGSAGATSHHMRVAGGDTWDPGLDL